MYVCGKYQEKFKKLYREKREMGIFSYDNPIMRVITKIAKCIYLSFLWIMCCIPVFTVGASTTALYYTIEKTIKNDRGYVGNSFFHSFRDSFKASTAIWAIMFLAEVIFAWDFMIFRQIEQSGNSIGSIYPVFAVFMCLTILYGLWTLISIARFQNTVKNYLKNGMILMIRHLGATVVMAVNLAIGAALVYLIPLTALLMPVVSLWIISAPVEKAFAKYSDTKVENN